MLIYFSLCRRETTRFGKLLVKEICSEPLFCADKDNIFRQYYASLNYDTICIADVPHDAIIKYNEEKKVYYTSKIIYHKPMPLNQISTFEYLEKLNVELNFGRSGSMCDISTVVDDMVEWYLCNNYFHMIDYFIRKNICSDKNIKKSIFSIIKCGNMHALKYLIENKYYDIKNLNFDIHTMTYYGQLEMLKYFYSMYLISTSEK